MKKLEEELVRITSRSQELGRRLLRNHGSGLEIRPLTRIGKNVEKSRDWSLFTDTYGHAQRPRKGRSLFWGGAFVLLIGWTGLSWLGYLAADPLIAWLKATVLGAIDGGEGVAEAVGGKAAGDAVQVLNSSGIAGQMLNFAGMIAKPAIFAIWFLGIVVLTLAPIIASVAIRFLSNRR
ncbi:hypothetical protein [Shinella zoogloeoides]|uniref:Uncharacterized protein n=1 Tax=Shinella zoogloeoides TaxID=352475 RepID=A0A6N8TLE5_SHIZO|nr:hypothetical protein [Shinella zoogloeoides]MXO01944.1 hypothetical protein [Shinella zoogloeoides]UEX84477.1 hypothetical protein K8M09_22945 [Shinella zoogloeoides]